MEQFEQLLTCCVCLDRYRNPKLLPCQHSFCMEPCMEGLVDYVRRQVKCPECRAEHRIPYQGVQAFPTNVTLQRFLELHIEITGELPDPTSGQIMERCNVCSEKAYLSHCAHCEKKICGDCKGAHMDIMRREITRINSQIRRSLHRLQDFLAAIDKNTLNLRTNCVSVSEEIDEIFRRVSKAIKDRSEQLKGEIDRYLLTEMRNLISLKENLELEITNIQSNCDVADKHMNESVEWDDCELMDTKEIFLKTVEFLRNFEYENTDYSRRVRFLASVDPNQLVLNLASFGDLNITPHTATSSQNSQHLGVPHQQGLMRSKSDHRLTTQFRQQEERSYDNEPVLGGRKFGERPQRNADRYGYSRGAGDDYDFDYDEQSRPSKTRFRSRFVRSHQNDDSDTEQQRNVRQLKDSDAKDRDKVLDTEDVSRGQLSGIIRLYDCPRVLKRLQSQGKEKKEKKMEPQKTAPQSQTRMATSAINRQISEDDEISRMKRQNKVPVVPSMATASGTATTISVDTERPTANRVAALKKSTTSAPLNTASEESDSSHRASPVHNSPAKSEDDSGSEEESDSSLQQPKPPSKITTRSNSTDSSASTESSNSAPNIVSTKNTVPSKFTTKETVKAPTNRGTSVTNATTDTKKPFVSRFLPQQSSLSVEIRSDKYESSSEEESTSEESEEEVGTKKSAVIARNATTPNSSAYRDFPAQKATRDDILLRPSYTNSSLSSHVRSRAVPAPHHSPNDDNTGSRYGGSSYTSGPSELSRSRSSHTLKSRDTSPVNVANNKQDGEALSSWARYLKNKYGNRTGKDSRDSGASSAGSAMSVGPTTARRLSLGLPLRQTSEVASSDDDSKNGLGSPTSPTVAPGIAGVGTSPKTLYLRKRQQLFQLGGRGSEPGSFTWPRGIAVGPDNCIVVADSSNHRVQVFDLNGMFLKQFGEYGNGDGEFDCLAGVAVTRIGQFIIADRYNHRIQILDPQGRFLRSFGSQGTTDGKFNYPWGVTTDALGFIYVCDKENHRVQVFQSDGTFVGKFGASGRSEGQLEHPHYIAVSNTNRVIVSDSNNHRIQIFDVNGKVLSTFGNEGSDEGQFKFPRGVAVDDQGYIVVADSGNNRIQIFNPDGSFLKSFGSWGSGDCEFKGLEGVSIMSNGNILVCDRENHRIQVF